MQYREYIRRPDQQVFSFATGATHAISTTVINYQFAVSRGHNFGGQDFATTYFNGPSNVQFGLSESDPYRPRLTPLDNTQIYNPAAYSIASTEIPGYRSTELDFEGTINLARTYNVASHPSTFEMGFEARNAHKTQNENDRFYDATGIFPMNQLLGTASNPNYYDSYFTVGPLTDYGKIQGVINSGLQTGFSPNLDKNHIVSDPATWDTSERVYAGYLMDSISFGKIRLQGGLRIESTGSSFLANKVTLNGGAYLRTDPVTGNSGYVNFMPSVQLQYLIASNTNLRLAYGRGISRPNFQDIVPSVQVDPNTSPKSLQVGNPALLPTRANNYDVLIEHYFQPLGILQAGFFYKALSDPIYPTVSFVAASDPNFPGYLRQQSINGPSAHIAGFEAAWQQRLTYLPGLLSGLGVSANYSYAASRVTFPVGFSSAVPGGEGRIDHPSLQRQAPNTWNLGFTYDKARFSMRFGVSHNDANIYAYGYVHDPTTPNVDHDPILGLKGPLADQYLYAHTQFDVQGSYRVYRGLEFVVSGLNLSNEVFGFYTGSPIYPNQREYYKPTVIAGVRWMSAGER
jgi:TonB-dependent receptor